MLAAESHKHREMALRNTMRHGKMEGWIHDLACKCDSVVRKVGRANLFLDKFHLRGHVQERCRRSLNPSWGKNRKWLATRKVSNTSICEQFNAKISPCGKMARNLDTARYRAFWRHYCIYWNRRTYKMGTLVRRPRSGQGRDQ